MRERALRVLGLNAGASLSDVRQRYRELARTHHPDRGGDPARFADIAGAFEVLSRDGVPDVVEPGAVVVSADDTTRLANEMRAGARLRRASLPYKEGESMTDDIVLSLEEVAIGTRRALRVEGRMVEVVLPPGAHHGDVVQVTGGGVLGEGGAPDGDLLVRVHVDTGQFVRNGLDFSTTVDVALTTLILGGAAEVVTITGARVSVSVPPGSRPGDELTVPGGGIRGPRGRGSLRVRLELERGPDVGPAARRLLEGLRELGF